nr:hypothetical protein [Tanacetum cinerariifolium]
MVAYLTKSDASEGFNHVIDFLNGSYIKEVLRLDDAEGVDCLPNEEIFVELARMGYEKPSIKLTFYKAFFLSQWKFLIYTILQSMSVKRTLWNQFSSATASGVICLSTGRKFNFSKYIFDSLVQQPSSQPQAQQQTPDFPMSLLQEALDACAALTRRVEHLEYDKVAQALEIIKLKRRVKNLEKGNKLILFVERRYPLSRFTLDQMLNVVRLRVEEESKMSLGLLRFTRQQHQEGQLE